MAERFRDDSAPVVDVGELTDEAGAELLRDNNVWGIDKELRAASQEFGGHPLALTLLASYLKETQNGDARRRDHVRALIAAQSRTPVCTAPAALLLSRSAPPSHQWVHLTGVSSAPAP